MPPKKKIAANFQTNKIASAPKPIAKQGPIQPTAKAQRLSVITIPMTATAMWAAAKIIRAGVLATALAPNAKFIQLGVRVMEPKRNV